MLQDVGSSQRRDRGGLVRQMLRFPDFRWVLSLLVCTLAAALAFVYIDVPIAHRFYGFFGLSESLGRGFASGILLGGEAAVALSLVTIRITRGRLPALLETTGLACLTSICAFAINDSTLKLVFGVPNPAAVLQGARHAFVFLGGFSGSSFPSGHMVLAGSFAGVFMRRYKISIVPLSVLLAIAAVLLIVGDWHFVSDVIAGTFLGVSAGLLAGEVWIVHSRQTADRL